MSEALKKCLELQKEWSKKDISEKEMFKLMDEADKYRAQFTKKDWEELIASTGNLSAKIAWTHMMNERFPETKEEENDAEQE